MKCPFCSADDTQVIDSRVNDEGDAIRRRRRCPECDKRFTTYENAALNLPQVVKQNGTREEFSRSKLRSSFSRALHKRPVPTEYVDRAIEHIVQKILAQGEREPPCRGPASGAGIVGPNGNRASEGLGAFRRRWRIPNGVLALAVEACRAARRIGADDPPVDAAA